MKRNKDILISLINFQCADTYIPTPTDVNTQSTVGHHESICLQIDITQKQIKSWRRKKRETEKNPHKMNSQEKTPQEKTPQKSPVEKTPHPILGLVEKTPHPIFRLVEKTPELYKKPSFWNFDIFYLNCIQIPQPIFNACGGNPFFI